MNIVCLIKVMVPSNAINMIKKCTIVPSCVVIIYA